MPLEEVVHVMNPTADVTPFVPQDLYKQACANDELTISSWQQQWIKQAQENAKRFDINGNSAFKIWGREAYKPVIIAGSGPSLKKNAMELKNRGKIRIVSCLHNFGYFEDLDLMGPDDYYLTLDAGDITVREMCEGGKKYKEADYWARTKDRNLLAYISTPPELIEKWQGPKYFFFSPPANQTFIDEYNKIIDSDKVPCFQVGGNALGACLYAAKAMLGCGPVIFIGADFAFSRDQKFHAWENPYKFAGVVPAPNIYGDMVYTWQSYKNFKNWFEFQAMGGNGQNPQIFINCTEGGCLGAFMDPMQLRPMNMRQIIQWDLKNCLYCFTMHEKMPELMSKQKQMFQLLF